MSFGANRKLVYPATSEQELYRALSEEVKIGLDGYYGDYVRYLSPQLLFDAESYPEWLEELRNDRAAFRTALIRCFYDNNGRNLCGGYSPRHKANPGIRMWRAMGREEILATDVITTGAGIIRPNISEVRTAFEHVLYRVLDDGINAHMYPRQVPMVQSDKSTILQPHLIRYEDTVGEKPEGVSIRYNSTNLVYGDVYGELKQVYERRNNKKFLKAYLQWVKDTWKERIENLTVEVIDGYPSKGIEHLGNLVAALNGKLHCHPATHINEYEISSKGERLTWKQALQITYRTQDIQVTGCTRIREGWFFSDMGTKPRGLLMYLQHMHDYGIWRKPPESVRELVERVEYLLSITEVDTNAFYK